MPDLLEKELNSPKKSRAQVFSDILHCIKNLSKTLNRRFVLSQLNDFVEDKVLRETITIAAEKLVGGDRQGAREELKFGLKAIKSNRQGLFKRIHELSDFQKLTFAPVEDALGPAFQWPGIVQISGSRGDGKTWLVLYVAVALACGVDVFGWPCSRRFKVLIVDGELPRWTLQERIEAVCADLGVTPKEGALNVYSANESDTGIRLNLTDKKQVDEIVDVCSKFDVPNHVIDDDLIHDKFSALERNQPQISLTICLE